MSGDVIHGSMLTETMLNSSFSHILFALSCIRCARKIEESDAIIKTNEFLINQEGLITVKEQFDIGCLDLWNSSPNDERLADSLI